MTRLVGYLLSLWLIVLSCLARPHRARCPIGYDLRTGIRPSGEFQCWPRIVGDPEFDGTWGRPERGRGDAADRGRRSRGRLPTRRVAMRAAVLYLGAHGPVAPAMRITRRWPLVGMVQSVAWSFDGRRLVLRRVRRRLDFDNVMRAARARGANL